VLIERLQTGGGIVVVSDPDADTRARYRRAIHAAKQHNLVPDGYDLRHTGRNTGDLVVRPYSAAQSYDTDWNRLRLNQGETRATPPADYGALEQDPTNLQVAPESIPRVLDLLRAIDNTGRTENAASASTSPRRARNHSSRSAARGGRSMSSRSMTRHRTCLRHRTQGEVGARHRESPPPRRRGAPSGDIQHRVGTVANRRGHAGVLRRPRTRLRRRTGGQQRRAHRLVDLGTRSRGQDRPHGRYTHAHK
jgi:hypothetical protein